MAQFLAGGYPDFANHLISLPNGSLWQAASSLTSNHAVAVKLFSVSLSASVCYRPEVKIAQMCRRIARLDEVSCVARQLAETTRICSRPLREVALHALALALCLRVFRCSHVPLIVSSIFLLSYSSFFVLLALPSTSSEMLKENVSFTSLASSGPQRIPLCLGGLIRPHPHIAVITLSVGIV